MKNIEMIRKMTDEELEEWLHDITGNNRYWFNETICARCRKEHGGKCPTQCEGCIYGDDSVSVWLHQQAE